MKKFIGNVWAICLTAITLGILGHYIGVSDIVLYQLYFIRTGGWIDLAMGILLVIVGFIVFGLVWYGIFRFMDTWKSEIESGHGYVVGKNHTAAYTSLTPISSGSTITLLPVSHPESWKLEIKVDGIGKSDTIEVEEEDFKKAKNGIRMRVEYRLGRYSENCYIKSAKF